MNREIKFRAWHKEEKLMFTPETLFFKNPGNRGIWLNESSINVGVRYINKIYGYVGASIELMQYTGLKDKNGKEIYEGDIIRCDWNDKRYKPTTWSVDWDKTNCCFEFEGGSPYDDAAHHFEVIGNIHENPELLKSE